MMITELPKCVLAFPFKYLVRDQSLDPTVCLFFSMNVTYCLYAYTVSLFWITQPSGL